MRVPLSCLALGVSSLSVLTLTAGGTRVVRSPSSAAPSSAAPSGSLFGSPSASRPSGSPPLRSLSPATPRSYSLRSRVVSTTPRAPRLAPSPYSRLTPRRSSRRTRGQTAPGSSPRVPSAGRSLTSPRRGRNECRKAETILVSLEFLLLLIHG